MSIDDIKVESVPQYVDEWSEDEFARRLRAFGTQLNDIAKMTRGNWHVPPEWRAKLAEFHFIRLGTMTDVRRHSDILMRKALLEQQGWKEAPKGVRNALFPLDQEHGVYMCMPRASYRQWQDMHRELTMMAQKSYAERRKKDIVEQLEHGDGARMHIERFEATKVQTTVADLLGEQRDMAKRRK